LQLNNPKEYKRKQKLKEAQTIKEEEMAKELTIEAVDTLKNSKIEGMVVKLPEGQLDRNVYLEVKNKLELIGGSWKGGKVSGFVFNEDPTDLLSQIANGENRNLKKEFQFFGTPNELADDLVNMSNLESHHTVLEPSAGQGAIVKAIQRVISSKEVFCYELMPLNQTFLKRIEGVNLIGDDFLQGNSKGDYDRIIANPPFSKNQDIDHIYKMYSLLKDNGILVSISSKHWQTANNRKEVAFRSWLNLVNAEIIDVEAGKFKDSGTMIATCIIKIIK
jgi:phospholipid N-methyltransferase